ncbi:hypothetical protein IJI94_02000 [Candidatus Saccharibacteria bacterium]|nr:hypothetical protein [Candidatus Saccharibacteria bacterium]
MSKQFAKMLYQQIFGINTTKKVHKEQIKLVDGVLEEALTDLEYVVVRAFCGAYGRPFSFEELAKKTELDEEIVRFNYHSGLAKIKRPFYARRIKAILLNDNDEIGKILSDQRSEILQRLAILYWNWNIRWKNARDGLGDLHLSEYGLKQIEFYEREQRRDVVSRLSELLLDWEHSNFEKLKLDMIALASNMKPSIPYVEYSDDKLQLNQDQVDRIKAYAHDQATSVKECMSDLLKPENRRFDICDSNLSFDMAESLLRVELGVTVFDFIESTEFDFEEKKSSFPALYLTAMEDDMEIA